MSSPADKIRASSFSSGGTGGDRVGMSGVVGTTAGSSGGKSPATSTPTTSTPHTTISIPATSSTTRTSRSRFGGKKKSSKQSQDLSIDGISIDASRERVRFLLEQLEKEFEMVLSENSALKDRVEALEEVILPSGGGGSTGESASTEVATAPSSSSSKQKITTQLKRDSMVAASQLSQKIKTTYRLKTGVGGAGRRIFNKAGFQSTPNVRSELIGMYCFHKDGVWYVTTTYRHGRLFIATASADGTSCIADMTNCFVNPCSGALHGTNTGTPTTVTTYTGHSGSSVNCVKFHSKYDLMITASGDSTAHVWRPNFDREGGGMTSSGVTSSAPTRNDSSDTDKDRDPSSHDSPDHFHHSGQVIKTPMVSMVGHTNVVSGCDFLSTVDQCVTTSWDRTSNIYDLHTGELVVQLVGHDQELTDVACHPTTPLIVTSSFDTTFRLWDFREAIHSVCVFQGHSDRVNSTAFVGHDKVVSGSDDRTVKVWDLRNMRSPLANIHVDSPVNKLSTTSLAPASAQSGSSGSGSSHLIAIPLENRSVRIYDAIGTRICRLSRSQNDRMITSASFVPSQFLIDKGITSSVTGGGGVADKKDNIADQINTQLFTSAFDRRICWWSVEKEKDKDKEKEK